METPMSATAQDATHALRAACAVCAKEAVFQARVEWQAHDGSIRRRASACASHVIEAVQLLRAWGHLSELADGWLTVLALDPHALPGLAARGITAPGATFYSARLAQVDAA
jgi:hypothetical protein